MDIMNGKFDTKATCGTHFLLTAVKPNNYENGVKLATPKSFTYLVKLSDRRYDDLAVTIDGPQLIAAPDNAIEVSFSGLELAPRFNKERGHIIIATATGISSVTRS